jgi:uncharacterized protein (TIGR03437 family)
MGYSSVWRAVFMAIVLSRVAPLGYGQANGKLQIHFIDVGQGDAALLISPRGETVLFDSGVVQQCEKPLSYILGVGIKQIDYHIATHYHSDHIGCTAELLRRVPLMKDAIDRGGSYSSAPFDAYKAAVGSHRKTAQPGMKIVLDADTTSPVEVQVVALNGNGVKTDNENDLSVVSVIHFGKFDAEIGGDLSGFKDGDYEDIETGVSAAVGQIEVYKVHHHCSGYSSNQAWLARTQPMVGIISAGSGNTYGHPSAECLNRLHAAHVKTYWTERGEGAAPNPDSDVVSGNIVVQSEPGGLLFTVTHHGSMAEQFTSWEAAGLLTIDSVVNGASFLPGLSAGSWSSVYGKNLAATRRLWRDDEIVDGKLPTQLDGVSVTINGKPAAVNYISATQLNVQAPTDDALGPVRLQVTTPQGSASATVELQRFAPGLFTFDGQYVAAQHPDYTYVAKPGLLQGVASRPAAPGEVIILYGTGFGPTLPAILAGEVVAVAAPLANPAVVRIGGASAEVRWAGISAAGLWQINVKVPDALPDGDAPVVAEVNGVQSQPNVFITVRH